MTLDHQIEALIPPGWMWATYSANGKFAARAVLTSPDYKAHIGRTGKTVEAALREAAKDARAGKRE